MTLAQPRLAPLAVSVLALGVTAAGSGAVTAPWPGPPQTSPPQVAGAKTAPPPVWVETPQHSTWIAYSSYCWSRPAGTAACVDFLPAHARTDLPVLTAPAGAILRFHLRFAISTLSVTYPDQSTQRLKPARVASWLPLRSGLITLTAGSATAQQASYLLRLTLAP